MGAAHVAEFLGGNLTVVRKRLITVLTLNNGVLFRTRNFVPDYRYTLNFIDAWSVDEVILLDITRPGDGCRENFYQVVKDFAHNCFVPLTVGGGVCSINEFHLLLSIGADKIAVNSKAFREPGFIREAVRQFGTQCVIVSMDVGRNGQGEYEVMCHFGTRPTGMAPVEYAQRACDCGAGEILLQSIERDGTLEGYDNDLGALVSESVPAPVLLCSGAGNWQHFVDGFNIGKAHAVCTTNIYHFTESSIHSAKIYLHKKGLNVRL